MFLIRNTVCAKIQQDERFYTYTECCLIMFSNFLSQNNENVSYKPMSENAAYKKPKLTLEIHRALSSDLVYTLFLY